MLGGVDMQHVPFREVSQLFMSVGSGDVNWYESTMNAPSAAGAPKHQPRLEGRCWPTARGPSTAQETREKTPT
jgi:hypothetical protein